MALAEYSREEFVNELWNWQPGEHVVIVAPTGGGKSYLMWQLLEKSMEHHPYVRPVVLMPKPNDDTTSQWAEKLDLRETPTWPPRKKLFQAEPNGYVLWPPHARNLESDARHELISNQLRRGMDAQFWTPYTITLGDDAHSLASSAMYKLNGPIEEHLVNGRSNHSSIWLATQRPSGSLVGGGLTSFAWSSASHLFLGKTQADADIQKYGEIGGINPRTIEQTVRNLQLYPVDGGSITQWLYIAKAGPYAAIVNP